MNSSSSQATAVDESSAQFTGGEGERAVGSLKNEEEHLRASCTWSFLDPIQRPVLIELLQEGLDLKSNTGKVLSN